jgi:hypothetical protein
MSSEPLPARKPRRKWGWIFVALLLALAVGFFVWYPNTYNDVRQAEMTELIHGVPAQASTKRDNMNTALGAFGAAAFVMRRARHRRVAT